MTRRRQKTSEARDVWQIMTIVIIAIMVVAFAVLRYFKNVRPEYTQSAINMSSMTDIITQYLPKENPFSDSLFSPQLSEEAMMSQEDSVLTEDGDKIVVYISKPKGTQSMDAMLLLHSGGPSHRAAKDISKMVGERLSKEHNMVSIAVDWSEGERGFDDMRDVGTVLEWIKNLSAVKNRNIIILGSDYGAYLAVLIANDEDVDGVIAVNGYYDFSTQYQYLLENNPEEAGVFTVTTGCEQALHVVSCLDNRSIAGDIALDVPTLIIHNSADTLVPVAQHEVLTSRISKELTTVVLLSDIDTNHDVLNTRNPGMEKTWEAINTWLKTQFNIALPTTSFEQQFLRSLTNEAQNINASTSTSLDE